MTFLRHSFFIVALLTLCVPLQAQTNMHFTHPDIAAILEGYYEPEIYAPDNIISDPALISSFIAEGVNPDSLKATLIALNTFQTRNTGSDTSATGSGIGAARTWILNKFQEYSVKSDGRLLTGYFEFDQDVCNVGVHRNVVAVLPGLDISDPSFIVIEAHMDSRCEDVCDPDCIAKGMEDNGSGTALVIELARVMSQLAFDHTIVFMTTTGEEQGLVGANAFAQYATNYGLPIKAVLNNDIVGGIVCGETSSPPSCPGLNDVDSTQVRLFSYGGYDSPHKGLSRFIKLEYQEMIRPSAKVPMTITLMTSEDRAGRGGDHIPFRERDYPAMRFTSANEHGNADVSDPEYHDRQHTSTDILGVDTDGDLIIDSFYVDFNYLARNAVINGNAAAMAAIGPDAPTVISASQDGEQCFIEFDDPGNIGEYIIGLRVDFHDFDTLYRLSGATSGFFELPDKELFIFLSVAAVDSNGVESLFSNEEIVYLTSVSEQQKKEHTIQLLQNRPNPFDESTMISFYVGKRPDYKTASIEITDAAGNHIQSTPVVIREGMNEVVYRHGYGMTGILYYSLVIDGSIVDTRSMHFAN